MTDPRILKILSYEIQLYFISIWIIFSPYLICDRYWLFVIFYNDTCSTVRTKFSMHEFENLKAAVEITLFNTFDVIIVNKIFGELMSMTFFLLVRNIN